MTKFQKSNIVYPLLYLIGITVWYGIVLQQSENLSSGCGNLWIYCLISICIGWIHIFTYIANSMYFKDDNRLNGIVTMVIFAHFVWGSAIMGRFLKDEMIHEGDVMTCRDYYDDNGRDLLFLFDFNYWLQVALLCILFVCFCILACGSR